MNALAKLSCILLALACFMVPTTAVANGPDISGTYEYDADRSDDMLEAFTPAIDEMSRLKRGFARRSVRNQDDPPQRVRIVQNDKTIEIHAGDSPVIRAPLDGTTVDYVNKDDEPEKVAAQIKGDTIEVHRDFEDGEYRTTYKLDDQDRVLAILTDIDMDQLPKTVHYRRFYNRQ